MPKTRRRSDRIAVAHRSYSSWDRYSAQEEAKRAVEGEEAADYSELERSLHEAGHWINPYAIRIPVGGPGRRFSVQWFYGDSSSHEPWIIQASNLSDLAARNVAIHVSFDEPGEKRNEWLSLPSEVIEALKRLSEERGLTISEFLSQLVAKLREGLPYGGLVDTDNDLSLKVEEVLARLND